MLVYYRPTVSDTGPALIQHWVTLPAYYDVLMGSMEVTRTGLSTQNPWISMCDPREKFKVILVLLAPASLA